MEGGERRRPHRAGLHSRLGRHLGLNNLAATVYGLILMLALVVVNAVTRKTLEEVAVTLIVTGAVFWVAHVYANVLGRRLELRRRLTRAEMREEFDQEWPLVGVGIVPVLTLLIGGALEADRSTMLWIVTGICLGELALVGVVLGRRSGYGAGETTLVALSNVALGLVIVSLKVFVH